MTLPLEGIRVVDWTIWQLGPVSTALLADLGAEVIKIEDRVTGDPGRGIFAMSGMDMSDVPNAYFEANNRNKKSITLDLKKPEGLEVAHKLVAESDVFVQNMRKGVAERIGLGYDALREINPRLIYATGSGYGVEGPDSGEPSFDMLGQARSGVMLAVGEPDMPPLGIAGGPADQLGATMLAYAVLCAIIARERFGIGQKVDASHLGSMAWFQGLSLSNKLMMGRAHPRSFRKQAGNPLWNHYCCKDGRWLALAMLQADRYWSDFCSAIERPELDSDPRFTDIRVRGQNAQACVEILDQVFATKDRDEWMKILKAGGDFIYTIVNSVDDLPDDPQMIENDYIVDFDHPRHGAIQMVGYPVRLHETPATVRTPAPEFGQHTEEVLTELLGYSWEEVGELRSKEVT